ncbi:MAG: hypothetical protein IT450_07135, partial [Phycisphaerales bacterium]|nr:hypothetical protein [Phycisphaerales bacterium]
MNATRKHTLFGLLLFALPKLAAAQSQGTVYDLSADWSDTQNPFGVWSLKKSETALFTINQPDFFGPGLPAWADDPIPGTAHVPMWARWAAAPSWLNPGDIVMHCAESGRTGTDYTSVVWTAPDAGVAVISGALWTDTNPCCTGRQARWEIRKNDLVLSSALIVTGGPYSRTNPLPVSAGSGGCSSRFWQSGSIPELLPLVVVEHAAQCGHVLGAVGQPAAAVE